MYYTKRNGGQSRSRRKGRVDGCDFKKKGNCYNPIHSKENENKKCECCPDAKDRTYCVNPANPDVLRGSRNCFSSGFAVRRSSCMCTACLHLRDQRKEEDKKAALIFSARAHHTPTQPKERDTKSK